MSNYQNSGSLHLIADIEYLGRTAKILRNSEGKSYGREFHNIGVLFWRTKKGTGAPCPRFRIVGIGSNDEEMFREFNLIYKSFMGKYLYREDMGTTPDYRDIAMKMKYEVSKQEINAFVKFEKLPSHWAVTEINVLKKPPLIFRTKDVGFPPLFYSIASQYEDYLRNRNPQGFDD